MNNLLPKDQFASLSNDMHWHYIDLPARGSKSLGIIVLIHGSGPGASGWSNFQFNAATFNAAGYRVLVPDLPGYGYTSKPTDAIYSLDFFTGYLQEWLDQLEVKQCTLVGNSLGGAISMGFALENPERVTNLILMAPGGLEERETYFATEGIQAMVQYPMGSPEFTREVLQGLLKLLVFDADHVTDKLTQQRWDILQTQNSQVLASMQIPNLANKVNEITCPILVFWGNDDKFCPVSGVDTLRNNAIDIKIDVLNQCGHWVMVEYVDHFNQRCLEFLAVAQNTHKEISSGS